MREVLTFLIFRLEPLGHVDDIDHPPVEMDFIASQYQPVEIGQNFDGIVFKRMALTVKYKNNIFACFRKKSTNYFRIGHVKQENCSTSLEQHFFFNEGGKIEQHPFSKQQIEFIFCYRAIKLCFSFSPSSLSLNGIIPDKPILP